MAFPRIAVISLFSGIVPRGAERTADDFQQHLTGEVIVVGLGGARFPGGDFPELEAGENFWQAWTRRLRFLDSWVYPVLGRNWAHRFWGTYCFISANSWIDYIFSFRLTSILDSLKPLVVVSIAGSHTARVLSQWCRKTSALLFGIVGGGPGWAMRHVARQMNQCLVVQTPLELAYMRRMEPRLPTALIPLGVDCDRFRPPESDYGVHLPGLGDLRRPIFLSATALVPYKRVHLLIEAVSLLKAGSVIIAGNGPCRDDLLSLAGQSLDADRFRYVGRITSVEDLARLYQLSDVYCFTAQGEPFGNVLLEAMACDKPIVGTDDATRRWIVGDAGILVDVTDRQAFVEALQRAVETDWGDKPRRRAEFFCLQDVAAAWDELIAGCLAGTPNYFSRYERQLINS